MKVAIVGAGAMGSVYAALFAEAGHDVFVIDPWQAHVDEINRAGLRLTGASGDRTVSGISASLNPATAEGADLIVIATKAGAASGAARAVAPYAEGATAVTIQNGLGAAERVAPHLPNLLIGVAEGFGARLESPGRAHHAAMKRIRLGEPAGGTSDRLTAAVTAWRGAGFETEAYDDIDQLIWEKFICNVTFSAPCAVFDKTIGAVMDSEECWQTALACTAEASAAGHAEGVSFSFDDPIAYVTEFGARMPNARPSLALDHRAGRRSEIDAINGMVPVVAERNGLTAPVNAALTAVIRVREAGFAAR